MYYQDVQSSDVKEVHAMTAAHGLSARVGPLLHLRPSHLKSSRISPNVMHLLLYGWLDRLRPVTCVSVVDALRCVSLE